MSLELATTDELFAELKARHKGALLVTCQDGKVGRDDECRVVRYAGGFAQAIGLAEIGKQYLMRQSASDQDDAESQD